MILNSQIKSIQLNLGVVNGKIHRIKSTEEETNKILNDKQSELSKIFMSIENLENICKTRAANCGLSLNYNAQQFNPEADIKTAFKLDKKRMVLALAQLGVVNQFIKDFNEIIKAIDEFKQERLKNPDFKAGTYEPNSQLAMENEK